MGRADHDSRIHNIKWRIFLSEQKKQKAEEFLKFNAWLYKNMPFVWEEFRRDLELS